eukprot:TRINITY_DN16568_c0_g1_i2.p1 TRINITY_DN16568_c0_g1~~TRINITY_DN16568_c0_g1_i2.p1  ORF type:complete len:116 (+),score=3.20 TRINITY_DN16568_c0_g1_i2:164-511(+)
MCIRDRQCIYLLELNWFDKSPLPTTANPASLSSSFVALRSSGLKSGLAFSAVCTSVRSELKFIKRCPSKIRPAKIPIALTLIRVVLQSLLYPNISYHLLSALESYLGSCQWGVSL